MSVADMLGFGPRREFNNNEDGTISVFVTANPAFIKNPATHEVKLTASQFERMQNWLHGTVMIQNALPELSPQQREFLVSGLILD
jgi:hypothetical protein